MQNFLNLISSQGSIGCRGDKHRSAVSESSATDHHCLGLVIAGPDGRIVHGDTAVFHKLRVTTTPQHIRDLAPVLSALAQGEDGRFHGPDITVQAHAIPGGGAVLVVDCCSASDGVYRSMFECSVYGTYRDTLDGKPLACNPALARLNGYDSPEEYVAAVTAKPMSWYVEPRRAAEFRRMLNREGRVHDMVSEVYRHRTEEKVWITENAWYVRGKDGKPLYIEGTIQDATERVASLAAIERQANTDALTGCHSRFHFLNRLREATRPESAGAVLYIVDLDRFKEVNDMLGHAAGDLVLKSMSGRLQSIAGNTGFVARLGGDEFAMLQSGRHFHINADTTANAIVKALRQPINVEGRAISIGGSVGAAVYPAHAENGVELLTHADLALYEVKAGGRNGFRMFDHELKTEREKRTAIERELKQAIAEGELELYYQPLVEAQSGDIAGFEALMRWNHPRRGFMPPGQFIGIAEEAGLMTELGNWAIWRACEQAVAFPEHISVSVNVSPTQFRSAGILAAVREALAATGLAPSRLMLELTESAILPGESLAAAIMSDLQKLGVQLALDDFGTGYSSLSYLQRFHFSKLKIDRSFVAGIGHEPANRAIIRATMSLCRDLDIAIVAEGIETEEQAAIIRSLGGQFLQGYLYGKPVPYAAACAQAAASQLRKIVAKVDREDLASVA